MSAPFAWARTPAAPEPSPDDLSAGEASAWRRAIETAQDNPGMPVTVWKSKGEWLVLKNGEAVPSRARSQGTLRAPFDLPVRYMIQDPDGRMTWHELKRTK